MKPWLKYSLIGAAALATVAASTITAAVVEGHAKQNRNVALPAHAVALSSDPTSLERGHYLFNSRGCAECHGSNGAGRSFINEGGLHVAGPNITSGPGGVVANYNAADWERTIRHGVKPSGKPALIMPSEDYNRLTDDDLSAVVAYVRSLPPVAGQGAILELPVPVRALYGLGVVKDAAERIDHSLPPQQPVGEGVNVAHGQYVANMCLGCHGTHLSGGKIPGAPPSWPAAANLTPGSGSAMKHYADATQFAAMMRSGKRPDGSAVSSVMPFSALAQLNDTDVSALFAYLQTVPARDAGLR